MYLLSEESDQIETLIENTATGKRYSIEGRVASGDILNGNRRIYESKVLHPAMQKFLDEKVSTASLTDSEKRVFASVHP